MSKKIIVILLIVFAGIIVYLLFGRGKSPEKEFFVVEKQDLIQEISVVGKVKATAFFSTVRVTNASVGS